MPGTEPALICPGVVPVLVGPLQVLLTVLPGLLLALFGGVFALFKPSGMKNLAKLLWQQKVAVTILVVVSGGMFYGYRAWSGPTHAGSVDADTEKGLDWTTARFDLRRQGSLPGPHPTVPRIVWNFKNGSEGFFSSPAIVGNRIYIASARLAIPGSGMIYCLDAHKGTVVWANAPEGYRPTFSSPVVVGDYLVCGEGLHDTKDARVVCLDIRPEKRGEVVWTFATKNHVECTPVVANGKVYVGAGDDGYYCLDLKANAQGKPHLHWHVPGKDYPDAETSLAVHEGKVYAGLGNAGKALCVLDAETGRELKRVAMPYPVFSPASIADGKLYLGMGEGDYVRTGKGGEVRCLDLATLDTEWSFPLEQTVLGAVAIKDDKLYFGCRDGHVYALTRKGKLVGKFNVHSSIATSPAVTDKAVFAVAESGLLVVLDRHTMEPLWEFRLGTNPMFISSPVVAHGHVYVGTQNDGFLCVGEQGEIKPEVPLWANPLGGPGKAGNVDGSPLPAEPEVWWRFPGSDKNDGVITTSIAAWGDDLYVPCRSGKDSVLFCLPKDAKKGEAPTPKWTCPLPGVARAPLILGDDVLVLTNLERRKSELHAIDRNSGKLRWKKTGEGREASVTSTEILLINDPISHLSLLDLQGRKVWSTRLHGLQFPAQVGPMLVVLGNHTLHTHNHGPITEHSVSAIDRELGEVLWMQARMDRRDGWSTTPVIGKNRFFTGTDIGLGAYSLTNGDHIPAWSCAAGPPSTELVLRGSDIIYVDKTGNLTVVDKDSGNVKLQIAEAIPGIPPLVSRGFVLLATKYGLWQINLEAPETRDLVIERDDLGDIVAPMVLHDSKVYIPTAKKGLVCLGGSK